MKIKKDWIPLLHALRRREVEKVFEHVARPYFNNGLEVGAGDGYQTSLLMRHCKHLICTDINFQRITGKIESENVTYVACDAEQLMDSFTESTFDFIFSSNLLEHLPNKQAFLASVMKLLRPGGISVHIVPNRFWKFNAMVLHHLNVGLSILEVLLSKRQDREQSVTHDNNPKGFKRYSLIRRLLWPVPHGVYQSNLEEFIQYGLDRWEREFEHAGFRSIKTVKGPVCSSYGFGFDRLRFFLEKCGFCSEYIFILEKK